MWDESLIESKRRKTDVRKFFLWPLAGLFHAVAITALLVVSYWHVEAIESPQPLQVFVTPAGIPPSALGSTAKPGTHKRETHVEKQEVATEIVPEKNNSPEESSGEEIASSGTGEGNEGTPEGVIGGIGSNPVSSIGAGESPVSDDPVIITREMLKPVLIHKVDPEYPLLAIRSHIQGVVHLQAIISKTGEIEGLKELSSSHPLLTKAAIDAVQQWKYKPATLDGRPISVYFTVTVKFSLSGR